MGKHKVGNARVRRRRSGTGHGVGLEASLKMVPSTPIGRGGTCKALGSNLVSDRYAGTAEGHRNDKSQKRCRSMPNVESKDGPSTAVSEWHRGVWDGCWLGQGDPIKSGSL
jgi:hypothetical protein